MEALLMGPLELRQDGRLVEPGDPQQQFVLVVLLLHVNEPVSTDRLIDVVWGGKSGRYNPVPQYISRINKAFEKAGVSGRLVERVGNGYRLALDPEDTDVGRFAALCAEAEAAGRSGDDERRLAALRSAVALWRGPFLDGLDIDRVGAEQVISPEPKYLDALGDLAELELERGEHRLVRDRLLPVLAEYPAEVRLAALLMRALIANGDLVRAVEVYHRTREVLDERGMEPSVELRRLALSAQRVVAPSGLPAPRGPLVGRQEEIGTIVEAITTAVEDGVPALVWISGAPGIGKSALAVDVANRLAHRFPDHQVAVDLNGSTPKVPPMSAQEALAVLLERLGVPVEQIPATLAERRAYFRSILTGTRSLILLDNAESEQQVRDLLPVAAGCAGLVTSRRVGGVDTGTAVRLEPLSADAAGRLFTRLVGAARVRGGLAEVVAWCGGVPLLIRMVASVFHQHRGWELEYLLGLLRGEDSRLPDAPFGDQGAAAVAVSYRQLSARQRTMFRLLSALPGPDLGVAAAAALGGCAVPAARRLLEELHAASLLEEPEPERYRMLDPLKEYAARIEPLEAGDALDRLLDFQLVTVAEAVRTAFPFDDRQPVVGRTSPVALRFADRAAALAWLAAEQANLAAAVRSAAERGRTEHVWQLAVLLWRWHNMRGQVEEWAETLELATRLLDVPGGDQHGLAHVLLRLSAAYWVAGRTDMALELAARALTISRRLGDVAGEASAFAAIALVAMRRGEHESAVAHFTAALERYVEVGDVRGRAHALSNLGYLYEMRGELDLAEDSLSEAVGLLDDLGHVAGLAHTLENRGSVRELLGRLDDAQRDHERAHELAVTLGDVTVQAYALNGLGNVWRLRGKPEQALELHEQARVPADQVRNPGLRTQLYLDRGATFLALDDHRAARDAYLSAMDLAAGCGERVLYARAAHGAGRAFHLAGDCRPEHWQTALTEFDTLRLPVAAEVRAEYEELTCPCRAG